MLTLIAAIVAWQGNVSSPAAPPPTRDTSGAYLDPGARNLVERARDRRATAQLTIAGYNALVQQRISLGIRALRRDRLLYRQEVSARVTWNRDAADTITMLGAREGIPIVLQKDQVPEDLREDAQDLPFDPSSDQMVIGLRDSGFIMDPLAPGSEANYRFRSGDTTVISLQGGQTIRLFELQVLARREDVHLLVGSFWLEAESYGVVRALFKPARVWDFDRDLAKEDRDSSNGNGAIPGFLKPLRGEIRFITIEYALWEGRWWLPRLIALDGVGSAGNFASFPIRFERAYDEYQVREGKAVRLVPMAERRSPIPAGDSINLDSLDASRLGCMGRANCWCNREHCRNAVVILPTDTLQLLSGDRLPAPIVDANEQFISEGELRDIGTQLKNLPGGVWEPHPPHFAIGPGGSGLLRYNRVEALSIGARFEWDFGRLNTDATARLGVSDLWPNLEAGVGHDGTELRWRLAGYRRLTAANPDNRPLGVINSIEGLMFGRDDGQYFRTWGGEIVLRPATTLPQAFELRLFGEAQRDADQTTDFSVRHLFNADHIFAPNFSAVPATQFGAALTLRGAKGVSARGVTLGAELNLDANLGTYRYARGSLTGRVTVPLGPALVGALEVAGGATGTTTTAVPVQGFFFLGGVGTLRGYDGGISVGPAYYRGRLEFANRFPGARLAIFSDAGWAGQGAAIGGSRPLVSVGAGASFLDGIFRIDLARGLVAPTGWRLDFSVDGIL